jgi:hypothetical protein
MMGLFRRQDGHVINKSHVKEHRPRRFPILCTTFFVVSSCFCAVSFPQTTSKSRVGDKGSHTVSLADTISWLTDAFAGGAKNTSFITTTGGGYRATENATITDVVKCNLTLQMNEQTQNFLDKYGVVRTNNSSYDVALSLADLNPGEISARPATGSSTPYWVFVRSSRHPFKVKRTSKVWEKTNGGAEHAEQETTEEQLLMIPVADEQIGQRISKALTHAAQLCGATKPPF